MVNPNLVKKTEESSLVVNEGTKRLFQVIYSEQNKVVKDSEDVPKIKVSSLVSSLAFFYEKIRNSVDYMEDHLLRKNAIERIMKRQIVIEGTITLRERSGEQVAKHLISELIRAGYLPNNKVPETKIGETATVIERYIKLKAAGIEAIKASGMGLKEEVSHRNNFNSWIIALAASDIEERLSDNSVNRVVVRNMFELLRHKVRLPDGSPYDSDRDIQIYVGIFRNYLKFDHDMLGFIMFKYFNAGWVDAGDEEIAQIGRDILSIRRAIDFHLSHPLTSQLNSIIKRYTVFYTILADVIASNPAAIYESIKNDPKAIPRDIKKVCGQRYQRASSKLWTAAWRSIIYIFLTKSVFVFLIEAPAIIWFNEEMNYFILGINILFPAFLLFMVVLFTKLPSDANTSRIIAGVNEIAFRDPATVEPITLRTPARRSTFASLIFGILYSVTFFMSFGAVIWTLGQVGFTWVSIVIFLFFLAFVSFFSIRIRSGARELIVVEAKESIISFFVDFFYVPIIAVGKWLSERFSRVNVFVFILDFIIEAPFKVFVEAIEEWMKYVKERKDELV